jgi:predicted molibdopterin-dependent oxidoreductase YjgC
VFGAGGGTSSYRDAADADLVVLWGSNARETHPIFFHHVLKGLRRGGSLVVVDPRRTASAAWADLWLGLDVGADIALANAIGREILDAGLEHREFLTDATEGLEAYREAVQPYTLDRAAELTGVAPWAIRDLAHRYATAERAQLCWTLGITEHHHGVDNVLALINLALLTGHIGRPGSGLSPLRGQNNVQGGGDMGAIPDRLPGFQHVEDDAARARFEQAWGCSIPPQRGWHLSQMFDAMERGALRCTYVIGENPADSEADVARARRLLGGLEHLVVQDLFLTRTAELADVVLPAAADWCESEGTVTSSERRVQRIRKALDPPGQARPDLDILCDMARRLGQDWGQPSAEEVWDELRGLSPLHGGMAYDRLDELGGLQWPCPTEDHPGSPFLHGRLWARPVQGPRAPLSVVEHRSALDALTPDYPIRLTTGRRLDSYNSGVQSGGYRSPLRRREALCIAPEEGARLGLVEGQRVLVRSRRGAVEAPVTFDRSLRLGLAFLTPHFSSQVDTNLLTSDHWDPKSGTAEFKATAIAIEPLVPSEPTASAAEIG